MPLILQNVSYAYMKQTPLEQAALHDISLTIADGSFTALIGRTGSGKSTLAQHLNGILSPTEGKVLVDGIDLADRRQPSRARVLAAKRSVGLVFQYPESQLFEETVAKDIAFGPASMGLTAEEANKRARRAMDCVGLDYETYRERSPFGLSGGERRRVAIAGVIAMQPKYLVLDEPTVGLDPRGREEIMNEIQRLHRQEKLTIILVSHNMDDVARLADRVICLGCGRVLLDGAPADVFADEDALAAAGLKPPQLYSLLAKLRAAGLPVTDSPAGIEEAVAAIMAALPLGKKRYIHHA